MGTCSVFACGDVSLFVLLLLLLLSLLIAQEEGTAGVPSDVTYLRRSDSGISSSSSNVPSVKSRLNFKKLSKFGSSSQSKKKIKINSVMMIYIF